MWKFKNFVSIPVCLSISLLILLLYFSVLYTNPCYLESRVFCCLPCVLTKFKQYLPTYIWSLWKLKQNIRSNQDTWKQRTQEILSSIINNLSFRFFPSSRHIREITSSCLFSVCLNGCLWAINSCDPSPRTRRGNKEHRLQSSTTNTTSSSSSYYLSAPSPPSMASRSGDGTERKKSVLGSGSTADRIPSRWYTVLALPFPDQRLGRRDINTFGQGGIYTSSRAGYFSNQDR